MKLHDLQEKFAAKIERREAQPSNQLFAGDELKQIKMMLDNLEMYIKNNYEPLAHAYGCVLS